MVFGQKLLMVHRSYNQLRINQAKNNITEKKTEDIEELPMTGLIIIKEKMLADMSPHNLNEYDSTCLAYTS